MHDSFDTMYLEISYEVFIKYYIIIYEIGIKKELCHKWKQFYCNISIIRNKTQKLIAE